MVQYSGNRATREHAIKKASSLRLAAHVRSCGSGQFYVPGSKAGSAYLVSTVPAWSCECPAGRNSRACYHQAAVWLYLVARKASCAPKPEETPAPPAVAVAPSPEPCPLCGGGIDDAGRCLRDRLFASHAEIRAGVVH